MVDMSSKKSFASFSIVALASKRWNKFFYRSPKGTIDPDSEWKQQNEQQKNNQMYKLVDFKGGGELIREYDKGKTLEEKKLLVQEYFKSRVAPHCLHDSAQTVTEERYEQWRKEQTHVATKLMQQKEQRATVRNMRTTTAFHIDVETDIDIDILSIASLDSVVKPYQDHKIRWKLEHRGAIGETPIHLLFLIGSEKHIAIAEALLELYPELAMDLYEGYEYYGESCLHFAIIQKNLKAVKVLLNTGLVDLHARARGKFFIPVDIKRGDVKLRKNRFEGYAYYGEYPLSFAASIGKDDIYDVLIAKGCDPNKVDRYGNGVLHLAVIHDQPDMYQHALLHPHKRPDPNMCNNNKLTPLALAAKLGKVEMFEKILDTSSRRYWSYNTITCSAYPLKSFDTIGPNGETDWNSALMMIVRGKKDSHLNLISNHVVHQLLDEKWKEFGRDKFVRLLAAFILHLIFLSCAVYLRPDQASDLRYGTSSYDIARYVFECFIVLVCLSVIGFALKEVYLESLSGYWQNLLAIPSRIFYLISVILLLLCIPIRFVELYEVERWLLVIAVPGLWSYMLFFLRNSLLTGPFITIIFRIFRTDLVRFAVIYAIVLVAYALAFFYQFEGRNSEAFLTEAGTVMTLFQMSFGEFDSEVILQGKYQALTISMFVFFMIIVHILLLNMLIAMITRTFEKITQKSEKVWRRQWAAMVVTMERSHSKQEKLAFQRSYDLNIDSNRVTTEGDAENSDPNEQVTYDKRALMVVHQQKKSESQRKGKLKQLVKSMSLSRRQQLAKEKATPPPSFQVKSMAGLSDLIRDAPRLNEEDSTTQTLNYSDDEQED